MRLDSALFLATLVALAAPTVAAPAEDGIPVESELVRAACGACHQSDDDGRMSRISYMRKTPEGWQLTLKRMLRTNNVELDQAQARAIVRYLSDHHGLAPEEERPYFYRAEKRPQQEPIDDKEIEDTCVRCHMGARFLTQRRTKEEWDLLKGMHIGYFPVIEYQTFRGPSPAAGDAASAYAEYADQSGWRVDRVIDKLAKKYPLQTSEWKQYRAKGSRGLEGRWLLSTQQPGKGPASGVVTFTKEGDDYVYSAEIVLADGSRHEREGEGVLYGGYAWRGKSSGDGLGELREVLMTSPNETELEGRFFEGTFGEMGIDVTLERLGGDPRIAAVWPRSAKVGERQTVRVLGANFTPNLQPGELDFGDGVTVHEIEFAHAAALEVDIEVSAEALTGYRNVALGAGQANDAFAVYDRVDYVKVLPEEQLARVGGGAAPKQFARFEAVAYHRGADDEPLTEDDVALGTIQPEWSIEEYHIREKDDDVQYVGTIDQTGLFTPAIDGPNPDREIAEDNFGDVWVVASYRPEGSSETLRGRSRLVVTIPVYVYWELFP